MLRPDDVAPIIERLITEGEDRRDAIVRAVADAVVVDEDELVLMAADKAVSLALAAMRDSAGDRLAYPSRNEKGERTIVHVDLTKDYRALHRAGVRLEKTGRKMAQAGQRLQDRAIQLGLFDEEAA